MKHNATKHLKILNICRKHSPKITCLLTAILLLANGLPAAAAAISVVESVQNSAASLRNKAREINYKRNNLLYIERIKQWLEDNKNYQQKNLLDQKKLLEELPLAQKNLQLAQEQAAATQQKSSEATAYLLQAHYILTDPSAVLQQINREIARLDQDFKAAQAAQTILLAQAAAFNQPPDFTAEIKKFNTLVEEQKAALAPQILSEVGYDENNLVEAEKKLTQAVQQATAAAKAKLDETIAKETAALNAQKQAHAEQLAENYALIDTLSPQLITLYKQQEAAYLVHSHAESVKYVTVMENYVTSLKNDLTTIQENLVKLQKEAHQLQLDLKNTQKQLLPVTVAKYANTQTRFYTWQNDKGDAGQQFYQPLGFYTLQKNTELGLYSGYINSRVNNQGSFSGITDTSLYIGQISRKNPYTITYMLDLRLPTGNSEIPLNSIVSDDLVEFSHLGEGFNWAPGIKLSKQVGEEDIWSAQLSYNVRGNYNYTPGTKITPGDEFLKSLSWQHTGQTWQFLATVWHTNYSNAKENDISYRKGNKYDFQATYNRVLTPVDDLMFYYWFSTETQNKYLSAIDFPPGSNLYRHYLGTQWVRKINNKAQISLMFNTMFSRGDNYDPITYQRVTKRNKYALRLGYSWQVSSTEQMLLQIERFYMYDDNENSNYRGNNYYLIYSKKL